MADTDTAEGVFVVAICPICQGQRYRSRKPIGTGDQIKASDFQPLNGQLEANDGTVPLCSQCDATLKFIREDVATSIQSKVTDPMRRERARREFDDMKEQAAKTVTTIFQCATDETIINIYPGEGKLLVLTNKRIVEVPLGG